MYHTLHIHSHTIPYTYTGSISAVLAQAVVEGIIIQSELDNITFPVYYRTVDEVKAAVAEVPALTLNEVG